MPSESNAKSVGSLPSQPFVLIGRHLPTLDGIRGLAILPVLVYHFADQFQANASLAADKTFLLICQAGWVGVDLFFVLSGFLITGILLDTRTKKTYFTSFYGRRVLRIFPAYYATLAAFFLVIPWFCSHLPPRFQEMSQKMADYQLWFWCYLANWLFAWKGTFGTIPGGYFWSLAVEEQFYLVWPLFVFWLRRDWLSRCIWFLLPTTILLRLGLIVNGFSPVSVYSATITHLDGLLAGASLAILVRRQARPLHDRRFGVIAAISALMLLGIGLWQGHFRFWDAWIAGVGLTLLAVCFSYLLLATIQADQRTRLHRIFDNRVLRSFGRYSYVIYLLHVPVGLALEKLVFAPQRHPIGGSILCAVVLFMILGTCVCWVIGFASWNLFEKQFLRLKDFLPYETKG